jgi:hypothetical protein
MKTQTDTGTFAVVAIQLCLEWHIFGAYSKQVLQTQYFSEIMRQQVLLFVLLGSALGV